MPFCSKSQRFSADSICGNYVIGPCMLSQRSKKQRDIEVVFVAALEVRSREISMPGGRSHCSCEFWRQHCSRTRRMTNHNWQIFWLADSSCKFSFLVRTSFFFRGAMTFIQENVNIWTEHWQAGAAQLPMWGAPCFFLQVRIHCLFFFVESFAFKS